MTEIALAIRQSPDWDALAHDHAAGHPIDPARFAANRDVPSFPADIATLIARWDRLARVPFFACRSRLKAIATTTWQASPGLHVLPHAAVPAWFAAAATNHLVMYSDDDDWLAPNLAANLATLPLAGHDALVFPQVRIGLECNTFAAPAAQPAEPIGPLRPFAYRYHTNNHLFARTAFAKAPAAALGEHMAASEIAAPAALQDLHIPTIISATSKTPCSASILANIVADAARFTETLDRYLATLKRLPIPPAHAWLATPLWDTIRLFEQARPRF